MNPPLRIVGIILARAGMTRRHAAAMNATRKVLIRLALSTEFSLASPTH
jgi:hypothetical protein